MPTANHTSSSLQRMANNPKERWSPLTCIEPVSLSASGLIVLEKDEILSFVRTNVEMRYGGSGPLPLHPSATKSSTTSTWNATDVGLSCHITTHRISLLDEKRAIGGSIPFPLLQTAHPSGGASFRSPRSSYKIELSTHAWGELILVFRGGESGSYTQSSKDRDEALDAINRSLKRQAWRDREKQAMKEALRPSRAIAASKVGVDAILTQNALRHQENAKLAESAFGGSTAKSSKGVGAPNLMSKKKVAKSNAEKDIDTFLGEATELIQVIEKYVATIERASNTSPGNDTKISRTEDAAKLACMLENMGMTSALTEKQSGSLYHKQLARQIVDFLHQNDKIEKAGGMMTLMDVYCLFNRARATNMISPEDLLKALDWMKNLNLGISKRSLGSGVLVVQSDAFDDEKMAKSLADLATSSMQSSHNSLTTVFSSGDESISSVVSSIGGITALDVSKILKIPALLANEQLLLAEQAGWLCRDSTIEGVRFFPNLFRTGEFGVCVK